MTKQSPRILHSPLTNDFYIVTEYKELGEGRFEAIEKYGATDQVMDIIAKAQAAPIPMVLHCPACGAQHVDRPVPEVGWDNPPHRSHLCHHCKFVFRPADVATVGVAALKTKGAGDTVPDLKCAYCGRVRTPEREATPVGAPSSPFAGHVADGHWFCTKDCQFRFIHKLDTESSKEE